MPRFFAILFTVCYLLFAVPQAQGFVGPGTNAPGSGGGMFSVDPNRNIGFGTQGVVGTTTHATPPYSDPYGMGKIFMIASTSTPPGIGLRNLGQNLSGYDQNTYSIRPATYLLRLTPWGGFTIFDASETTYYSSSISRYRFTIHPNGGVTIGSDVNTMDAPPPPPTGETAGKLEVFGSIKSIGGSFIGALSGSLSAANVTGPSAFGINYGTYNYAFPGALAVGTSTTVGLPSSGLFVVGNVGIGTTSPGAKLHVNSTGGAGTIRISGVGEGDSNIGQIEFLHASYNTNPVATIQMRRRAVNASGALVFQTAESGGTPADRMFINYDGNVGIGTTGPSTLLSLSTTEAAATAVTMGYLHRYGIGFNTAATQGGGYFNIFAVQGAQAINLGFDTGSYGSFSEKVTIKESGNVGIGTTGPGYKLEVKASAATEIGGIALRSSSTASPLVVLHDTTDDGVISLYSGATKRILLDSAPSRSSYINAGNVGIGTTNPTSTLSVAGTLRVAAGGGNLLVDSSGNTIIEL